MQVDRGERFRSDMRLAHSEAVSGLAMIVEAIVGDDPLNPMMARGAATKLEEAARTIRERIALRHTSLACNGGEGEAHE